MVPSLLLIDFAQRLIVAIELSGDSTG